MTNTFVFAGSPSAHSSVPLSSPSEDVLGTAGILVSQRALSSHGAGKAASVPALPGPSQHSNVPCGSLESGAGLSESRTAGVWAGDATGGNGNVTLSLKKRFRGYSGCGDRAMKQERRTLTSEQGTSKQHVRLKGGPSVEGDQDPPMCLYRRGA